MSGSATAPGDLRGPSLLGDAVAGGDLRRRQLAANDLLYQDGVETRHRFRLAYVHSSEEQREVREAASGR